MIIITLNDLIYIVPDLINLFLSGFIFIYTYNWINNIKMDIPILTLWSLFVTALIKSFYSSLHIVALPNMVINDSLKIIIYSVTGFLLAIILTYITNMKLFTRLLYKINNKSINNDIFDDIIDYDKRTMMKIYIKSSDIYYIGRFSFREENGADSWISLVEYCCVDTKTNDKLFGPSEKELCSSVTINLNNIERIEIIYEKDSDVWKRMKSPSEYYS